MKIWMLLFGVFTSVGVCAQVPVSKEPHHHVVLDNEKIRVLNVLIDAGDTTQYHLHSTPSVFINFTKTTTGNQLLNGQPTRGISTAGTIYFEDLSAPHNRVHRVWNEDTATYHVMDIELLSNDTGFKQKPLTLPYTVPLINNPWVRAYRMLLGKAQTITLKQQQSSYLLVAINVVPVHIVQNGAEKITSLKAGDFIWVEPGAHITITNTSETSENFVLLEIK